MGNSGSSSSKHFWPPSKLFKRESKGKDSRKKKKSKPRRVNSAPPVAPMYDTVADVPLYSVVDKSRKRNIIAKDDVQYAEIEVVRRPPQNRSQKKPNVWQNSDTTEYATINFNSQENYTSKNASTNPYSSVHQSRSAGQIKPSRRYNSVNGTLV